MNMQTNNAPSLGVVMPHFAFAGLAFLVSAVLLVFGDSFMTSHYFEAHLLAITHIAALGWGVMIIMGALYQLIPVVYEVGLYSENLAKFTFVIFGISVAWMVYIFWVNDFIEMMPYVSILMYSSVLLFIVNVVVSTLRSSKRTIQSLYIWAAMFWLSMTALFGLLMALNYKYNFLSHTHLEFLRMHANMGVLGWFTSLIIGVGSILLPMFFVSHQLNENYMKWSFYSFQGGITGLILNWYFIDNAILTALFWILLTGGIILFILYAHQSYKKRMRKKLDVGMKQSVLSVLFLFAPIVIGIISYFITDSTLSLRFEILYIFSFLYMFISAIILGQTYKTIPFIIWLDRYQSWVGKTKTPLPRELYSEKIGDYHFYAYIISILAFIVGILSGQEIIIKIGSGFMLLTAIIYNLNLFKIILHKTKIKQ
jgi:hypothetical protein